MVDGTIDIAGLAALVAAEARPGAALLVGITGSVAVGKSTLTKGLAAALAADLRIEQLATDGYLRPNAVLDAAGLTLRKGFPESYDRGALAATLAELRGGGRVRVPGYSHIVYDVDPALARDIGPADIVLVEGLGLGPGADGEAGPGLDLLIYIDADEADIERWFTARFIRFWHAASDDSGSFYARFRTLSEADAVRFAGGVWANINLPNLRDHISGAREVADIVVRKLPDHGLALVRPRRR